MDQPRRTRPVRRPVRAEIVHLHTGDRELIDGRIACAGGASLYVRTLPRVRLVPGSRLHIQLRLFSAASDEAEIHRNDYVFGPAEEEAPFGGATAALLRRLFPAD